ncbi:MAG: 16S rRNA (cytidine(1402)-2'-O)-methyltransferase [Clostridia bacterium]|nr:16S rRNA (cytidine(1402)-2'-O)-methyltransferase [Clostridia bacterium]
MSDFEKNKIEDGTLYLVATPIGNLGDISDRAKKVLGEVDFIAAEDTRNSYKLISCLGIKNELVSYHEHNKKASGERIAARLLGGESCALITDAGMPAISDPGEDIVRLCADSGIKVTVVPGASAAVSALALSALSTGRFVFEGFLPVGKGEREARLSALKKEPRTMIVYEAPHKLRATLSDLLSLFGAERRISLCRELTKLNEDIFRTTLGAAYDHYSAEEPRGEYVLIIEGAEEAGVEYKEENPLISLSPEAHVAHYESKGMKRMDAIKAAAKDRGMQKSELYKLLIGD